jgi:hypothetical protein
MMRFFQTTSQMRAASRQIAAPGATITEASTSIPVWLDFLSSRNLRAFSVLRLAAV